MGCRELIESLRRNRDDKIIAIWEGAEAEQERIRNEAAREQDRLRKEFDHTRTEAVSRALDRALADVEGAARAARLAAQKGLSERLYSFAVSLLQDLRGTAPDAAFRALAAELPPLPWVAVRVHPDDLEIARAVFPDAEVTVDKSISGGMDAATDGERMRIVNTFEKRLERAWDEILPDLLKEMHGAHAAARSARKNG